MVSSARQLLLSPPSTLQSGADMKGQNHSRSLPHLSVISASGEEAELSESLLSPLTPQLAPTFRAQNFDICWLITKCYGYTLS